MTNRITPASLRGAVDLSSLARPANGPGSGQSASSAVAAGTAPAQDAEAGGQSVPGGISSPSLGRSGAESSPAVADITTEQFGDFVAQSSRYPVIIALWSSSQPQSRGPVEMLADGVRAQAGKVMLGLVDIDTNPEIAQAFQQLGQQAGLPAGGTTTVAFIAGQPAPIPPLQSPQMVDELLSQIGQMAVGNGITGRVPGDFSDAPAGEDGESADEAPLSPLAQEAYDAINRGDLDAAITAYEKALADNPADEDARLGLGQVKLLKRTEGVDLNAARADAAAHPEDVAKQTLVADLDVLGGHVEDAFLRLIDLVKATSGAERDEARTHLIGLFDIVGGHDERVKKARTALMSALY